MVYHEGVKKKKACYVCTDMTNMISLSYIVNLKTKG